MNPAEPFNFGRKIKDLKRNFSMTYADLTVGLKIPRERIVQLEENEREPTEAEKMRFAEFYDLAPEELGAFGPTGGNNAPPPRRPDNQGYGNERLSGERINNDRPGFSRPPNTYNNFDNNERPPQRNFQDRGGYEPREPRDNREPRGNYPPPERSNFDSNDRPPPARNFQDRGDNFNSNYGPAPRQNGGFNRNPAPPTGGGYGNRPPRPQGDRPPTGDRPGYGQRPAGPRPGGDDERPSRPPAPRPSKPKMDKPKPQEGDEPKPVMKYTAEQLGDIESAYLRKQRDLKVPLKFTFLNGKEYTGVVLDFTPFTVHISDADTGEELILRKLAMAYYRKADAAEEAQLGGSSEES